MRLMGLAMKESGLAASSAFNDWFVDFISHFVGVYERSAPPYGPADFAWCNKPAKVAAYVEAGYKFTDLFPRK